MNKKQVGRLLLSFVIFGFVLFVVMLVDAITCFDSLDNNKKAYATVGKVLYVSYNTGVKFKGRIDIWYFYIVDNKKFLVTDFVQKGYGCCAEGGYFNIAFLCENIRCAKIDISPLYQYDANDSLVEKFEKKIDGPLKQYFDPKHFSRIVYTDSVDIFMKAQGMVYGNNDYGPVHKYLFQLFGAKKEDLECKNPK